VDKDIEGVVDNARFGGPKILQKIEVRPTIRAKRHQLSVDDCVIWEITQCGRDVWEPLVQDVLPPGVEGRSTSTPHGFQSIAVQLDFVGPLRSLSKLEAGKQSMVSMKPAGCCGEELFFGMISGENNVS
jgi:hypothetical protein